MHAASWSCRRRWWPSGGVGCGSGRVQNRRVRLSAVLTAVQLSTLLRPFSHRETVFCREEAPPEAAPRPTHVVEATTANGACTLRVAALPLPASVATALDQNDDLLRLAFAAGKAAGAGAAQQQQREGQHGHGQQQGEQQQEGGADAGGGMGAPGSDSLAAFGDRLRQTAEAAAQEGQHPGLLSLLQRAWAFGPKRVGPNLLLAVPETSSSTSSSSSSAGESLFALPPERVAKLAKQQAGRAAAAPAALAAAAAGRQPHEAGEEGDELAEEAAAEPRRLSVPLGFPQAALRLGLASGDQTAASHAASALADLSHQLGSMLSVSDPAGSPAAAAAAENGSSAETDAGAAEGEVGSALGRSLEYLRYSVESGVAAGFQLASAAGPLCDEPLWGLAFQVEARLNLPAAAPGEAVAPGQGPGLCGHA